MKKLTSIAITVALTALITSIGWWYHTRRAVTSLTLISVKSDIYSTLNTLRGIENKDFTALTDELEQQLALSAMSLVNSFKSASATEKRECNKSLEALRRYHFKTTNDLTSAALAQLKEQGP